MTNKRQIPFLHWAKRPDGTRVAHWKPSPRLRKLGWQNLKLGICGPARSIPAPDEVAINNLAMARNTQLAEWEAKRLGPGPAPEKPRTRTFGDLIRAYRGNGSEAEPGSSEWQALAPATKREYKVRLRYLEAWALDGALPLAQLDQQMVVDLKEVMLTRKPDKADQEAEDDEEEDDDEPRANPNLHRTAATMRVLRLLLNWALLRGFVATNATAGVSIPTPPSRTAALTPEQVDAAAAQAMETGYPGLALAYTLNLWTIQRRADVLALNRMAWRVLDDVELADRAVLANAKGDVMGFRLRQRKTGKWVVCPVPPFLHDAVEAAFARSEWLVPDDEDLTRACPSYLFTRRTRPIFDAVGLKDYQFRDLRRSGMMRYGRLRCTLPSITAISGHAVLGKKTILDTYMPGDELGACSCVATALRTLAAREKKDQAHG